MLEDFLKIFEKTVSEQKKLKIDFTKTLKKKLVENAEQYAFLDPFAGEFEYADGRLTFTGAANDKELIDGVLTSVKQSAQEIGLFGQLMENSQEWSEKYKKQLENFSIKLEK